MRGTMTKAALGVMLSCLASCCSTVDGRDHARKMPEALFLALKGNDPSIAMPYVMTEDRYVILCRGREDDFGSPEEMHEAYREAAGRAVEHMTASIRSIHAITADEGGFDWEHARLEAVLMDTAQMDFTRVSYDPDVGQERLNVFLVVVSGDMELLIKLDDCFNVCGERYVGDGMRLEKVRLTGQGGVLGH